MPKATITKAAIGRVLDAVIARQDQFGCLEIKPDGTILIHPKSETVTVEKVDRPHSELAPKEW